MANSTLAEIRLFFVKYRSSITDRSNSHLTGWPVSVRSDVSVTIRLLAAFLLAFQAMDVIGQDNSGPPLHAVVQASGFLDMYYGFDFNQPASNTRPDFLFNHHRHNKIHANLALLQLHLDQDRYRANLGVMGGTYAQRNLAHEPKLLRHVYAANMGVALNQRSSLWLDVGVMPSHIGFESAISADNPTLTRSLAAENSPYYLAGARLSWDASPNWQLAALVLGGIVAVALAYATWRRDEPSPELLDPEAGETPATTGSRVDAPPR